MESIQKQKVNLGTIVSLELTAEICCDECGDIIHNHIDCCPVCGDTYAGTDAYCGLYDEKELMCTECNTVYELVDGNWYDEPKCKVIELGNI